MKNLFIAFVFIAFGFVITSCSDDYIPKPVGLFRIDIPKHNYIRYNNPNLPYNFDYADYAKITRRFDKDSTWINIDYPKFGGSIFITYHTLDTALASYINDCHDMAYKHTPKASNIETELVVIDSNKVYGLIYYIEGDQAASPLNFYLTDSTHHFIRGALYFNNIPRNDSLKPVIRSIEMDLKRFISGFKFKNK